MFGPLVKFNRNTITTPKHEFLLQFKYWLLDTRYSWRETDNEQVLFDVNSQRYLGFFHSDAMFFGLGDTFFDNDIIDTVNLCTNPKYRKEFIKKLREADKANDSDYFYRVIKKGITSVVPLRERGNRKITNMEEAYQAACNFAKYVRWW